MMPGPIERKEVVALDVIAWCAIVACTAPGGLAILIYTVFY